MVALENLVEILGSLPSQIQGTALALLAALQVHG